MILIRHPEVLARSASLEGRRPFPSPREAVGRVARLSVSESGRGGGRSLRFVTPFAPHPRPLPTTRFARGGRGEAAA